MFLTNLGRGLQRSWQLKKIITVFWITNLVLASLFLHPYINSFEKFFANRAITDTLAKENLYTYFAEFYHFSKPAVHGFLQFIWLGSLVQLSLIFLMGGGLVYYFLRNDAVALRTFWTQSGYFLGRMMRLVALTVPILTITLLLGIMLSLPLNFLLPDSFSEIAYFYVYLSRGLIIGILSLLAFSIIDLTKIILVKENLNSVVTSFRKSLIIFSHHPLQFGGMYFVISIFTILLFISFWWLQQYVPDSNEWGIFGGFLMLQIFILLQFWIRFSKYGALYQILSDIERRAV